MKKKVVTDSKKCCGCASCAQKCPQNAIIMQENKEGFLYPVVDEGKCINCGLCKKICPVLNEIKNNEFDKKIYALRNRDFFIQIQSSSGGIFSEIADFVFSMDGLVCGAAFDENFKVKHIIIDSKNELYKIRKSKYIQSNINEVYKKIEIELKKNRVVLFSGTPCQVHGLKCFVGKNYDNLLTCDIVCHGVPSQKAFSMYLEHMSKKRKSNIKAYDFRSKDIPGLEKIGKVEFENGKSKYLKIGLDVFYNNFIEGNIFRDSCYSCQYSNMNRVGDITIGDYIGVQEVQPEAYSQNGTSICIVNSAKGERVFNNIKNKFELYIATEKNITKYNANLNKPKDRPECRNYIYANIDNSDRFYKDLRNHMNKKSMLKSLVPIKIKRMMKKLGGK